jgi:hypothetical protein
MFATAYSSRLDAACITLRIMSSTTPRVSSHTAVARPLWAAWAAR